MHADRYTLVIISLSFLLRMTTVSDKSYTGNQNTQFVFNDFFFKNRTVCEIMWKKKIVTARQTTDGSMIRRMRFACWKIKATNTHSKYVMLIASPQQR